METHRICAHLSNTLHGATDDLRSVDEPVEVPPGYFGHYIVQAGLKAGGSLSSRHVRYLWQLYV